MVEGRGRGGKWGTSVAVLVSVLATPSPTFRAVRIRKVQALRQDWAG
jgi:ABC-type lipoprotein release transport system permease subunit